MKPVNIAVNISILQFKDRNFVNTVAEILRETGLKPNLLELEITESVLMTDVEEALQVLKELKARGIQLSIDDFGTGYSSFAYLKEMPINTLKIDQSLVKDITTIPNDASISRAIVQLAHSLGMSVIAEGVESIEQLRILQLMECDYIQGYLISRPVSSDGVQVFLEKEWRCHEVDHDESEQEVFSGDFPRL